jgi:benzoylformate decarboxylase
MSAIPATRTDSTARPTVREATLDLLRELGMTTVFGNPGSTELGFLDRWPSDFRYVLGLQEASVLGMADGYARATGRCAFVNLHSAAGVGHALGNLFTAHRNGAPLVVTAGQQTRSLLSNLPFLGATEAPNFPRPYVKFSIEPARAEDVPAAIAQAHRIAMQRPYGPTFVSVPSDDWSVPCQPVVPRAWFAETAPDPAALAEAARAIAAARRPVLVVGPEVDSEGAGPDLVALAERMGVPVRTSPFSSRLSFPEDHPLFAGHLPAAPQAVSDALIAHDLVLVIGAPVFTFHVPGDCALFRSGIPIFQMTTDTEAASSAPAGTAILGSLRLGLPALAALLPENARPLPAPRPRPAPPAAGTPVSAPYALHRLHAAMPEDAILVEEAPSHRPAMQAQMPIRRWGGFFTMASGGLGYSLPAAVGVALASPGRRVVCLIGDGSFMYSPQALWTAVQAKLPLAVIVMNNSGYGAMRSFSQVLQVRDAPGIDLPGIDFVSIARGMGCPGRAVATPEELDAALAEAMAADGPMLVEVALDSTVASLYDKH